MSFLPGNIRYLRKKRGFSQDFIAEKMGYKSYTTIQKWEMGVSEPPLKKLKILADILNSDMDDMTRFNLEQRDCENNTKKSSPESLLLTDEEIQMVLQRRSWSDEERMLFQQLWDTFDKMSAKDRSMILGMIEAAAAARNRA